MEIFYPLLVQDKKNKKVQSTHSAPIVHFSFGVLTTLVMFDPNAVGGTKIHWLIVDIPPCRDIHEGRILLPYTGPAPPQGSGLHHYIFLVLQQDKPTSLKKGGVHLKELFKRLDIRTPRVLSSEMFTIEM